MKLDREVALANRDRLLRMTNDKDSFVGRLNDARMSVYKVRIYVNLVETLSFMITKF